MTTTARPTAKPSKLVRLESDRASRLDRYAEMEDRTQVAQLGRIFDAGEKALGLAPKDET